MIYILITILLLLLVLFWFAQNSIRLPSNTDELIAEIESEELPELMPGTKGFTKNDEVKICYETIGKATHGSILLLNGHSQTMLGFPPRFYQPFLDAGYQVIRMDNRGTGESDWLKNWTKKTAHSLEDMAQDAIAVLDALQIEKVHVVGYSMGGMIGQRLAISFPNRVQTLTSAMSSGYYEDPALTGLPKPFVAKIALTYLTYAINLKTIKAKAKLHLAANYLLKGGDYKFDDKGILQRAFYEISRRKGYNMRVEPQHTKAIQISGSRYEELKELKTPTLVIHGKSDPLVLFENAEKYAPLIPNVKTLYIDDLGHHFPEKYTPEITTTILKHLKTID